jgi:hypothetical protein
LSREGLDYATLRPEVEDEMYELKLIEMLGTLVIDHTKDPEGVPLDNNFEVQAPKPK